MQYSFLFLQQDSAVWKKILSSFISSSPIHPDDFELMFVLSEKNEEDFLAFLSSSPAYQNFNIKASVFSSVKEENCFTRAFMQLDGDNVVIVRGNVVDFPPQIWVDFLKENNRGSNIVVSKQETFHLLSDVGKGFSRLTAKLLYGFEPYDGEADIILLDSLALSIIKATPHLALLFTKLNAWNGLSTSTVEIPRQKKRERASVQPKNLIPLLTVSSLFSIILTAHLLLTFLVGLNITLHIIFIGAEICVVALLFYFSLRIHFLLRYGALKEKERSSIIKNIENWENT